MTALSATLTELQLDALTELVNLGIANAALQLRGMLREEVVLTIPKVSLMTAADAITALGGQESRRLVAVHQDFVGALNGRAVLLFPQASSVELVRALVGGDLPVDEMMELEQEAFAETGNILLNACIGTIANCLQQTLRISLPEVVHSDGDVHFMLGTGGTSDRVLFIHINFAVQRRSISGYIAMLLDLPSLLALQELLDAYIQRMTTTS